MVRGYDREARLALRQAAARGEIPTHCPVCGGELMCTGVERPPAVSYVRQRVMLVCSSCRRGTAVDVRNTESR